MNPLPLYLPGEMRTADTPFSPPPDPAPTWWPEWAPPFSPEAATVTAALAALVILLFFVVVAVRRRQSTPTDGGDRWIRRLVVMVALAAPFMLGLTFYGSFYAVEELAAARGVHPSWVPPLAIDGILVLFLLVDLLFARLGTPKTLVKNVTRGFILLTLLANATSGWGDPVAVFLHIPAPLALVVMTEVARQALVDEARRTAGKPPFDPIPFMRWVLDPLGTFGLWRRMILQDVRSYAVALSQETDRRDALAILATLEDEAVPAYLSRRLRVGMDIPDTVARVRSLARVDEVAPVVASSTPVVDEGGPGSSTSPTGGVDVHSEPTPSPTPAPAGGVDTASSGVGEDVGTGASNTPPAGVGGTVPPAGVHTEPAPRVDEGNETPAPDSDRVDVHTDTVWRSPGTLTGELAGEGDEAPDRVAETAPAPAPARVETTDANTDGDDEDPDDDGPRGGGAPAPAPVVPGQITIADALEAAPTPGPLDVARVALDAPTWDEVTTKKDKVMALLWETHGDVTAVRAAYADRTGDEVPRDLYRAGARGYAHQWHHEVTAYLISHYGNADTVRATLADAGVDHTHEAVTAALDEWSDTHGSQVLQFRRVPTGP